MHFLPTIIMIPMIKLIFWVWKPNEMEKKIECLYSFNVTDVLRQEDQGKP